MSGSRLSICVFLVLSTFAPCLSGHAILLSAMPAARQLIKGPDFSVALKFNSRIDAKRSRVVLVAPEGTQVALELRNSASHDTLVSSVKGLKAGTYTLRWQVLANDGHITRGEFPFKVQ